MDERQKIYTGFREVPRLVGNREDGYRREFRQFVVEVNGKILDPRYDLAKHSSEGFAWGHNGPGAAQLAFAILCDCLGADAAKQYYWAYKERVLPRLTYDTWSLTEGEIFAEIVEIQANAPPPQPEPEPEPEPPVIPVAPAPPTKKPKRKRKARKPKAKKPRARKPKVQPSALMAVGGGV